MNKPAIRDNDLRTVDILIAASDAGRDAFKAGQPKTANPIPYEMSATRETQVREHEAWDRGWDAAKDAATGWADFEG